MRKKNHGDITILYPTGFLDKYNAREIFNFDLFDAITSPKLLINFQEVAYLNFNVITHIDATMRGYSERFAQVCLCALRGPFMKGIMEHEFVSAISVYPSENESLIIMQESAVDEVKNILITSTDAYAANSIALDLKSKGYQVILQEDAKNGPHASGEDAPKYDLTISDISLSLGEGAVQYIYRNGVIFLYIAEGVLDATAKEKIDFQFIVENIKIGHKHIVLNFSKVIHINTNGFNHLKWVCENVEKSGGHLCLVQCPEAVRRVIENIDPFIQLQFFKTEEMAISFRKTYALQVGEKETEVVYDQNRNNIRALMASPKCTDYLNSFIYGTVNTLKAITNIDFVKGKPIISQNRRDLLDVVNGRKLVAIGFHGDISGMILLAIAQKTAHHVTQQFVGGTVPVAEFDDALMEVLNIVAGKIKKHAYESPSRIRFRITLPHILTEEVFRDSYNISMTIRLPFTSTSMGNMDICVF